MVGASAQTQPYSEIDNNIITINQQQAMEWIITTENHTDMITRNQQNIPFINYLTS
jgi:hypothetical protein